MENQIEYSKFLIERYDNYISGANTKGNFLLAFNTLMTGGIIANYGKLIELVIEDDGLLLLNISIIILIAVTIFTTIFVVRAVYPYLASGNSSKSKYHSHIFFNSVAEFDNINDFNDSYCKQSDKEVKFDLSQQVLQLAKGLKKKYCYLEWAMRFVYFELFITSAIVFILIVF